jgi:hypothetical protein
MTEEGLDIVLHAACRLLAADDRTGAIRVIPGRRPTYRELLRWRAHAADAGLRLALAGDGAVTLRRAAPPAAERPRGRGWRRGLTRRHS